MASPGRGQRISNIHPEEASVDRLTAKISSGWEEVRVPTSGPLPPIPCWVSSGSFCDRGRELKRKSSANLQKLCFTFDSLCPLPSSGTHSPGKTAADRLTPPRRTPSHAEVDGEHTAAPLMGSGTVRHGTLPGLNGAPTLDTWDSGAPLLALRQARPGTFVLPGRRNLSGKISQCGSHASLYSTPRPLCAQLAWDSLHFLSFQSGL
ncbi:hypothetical protein AOLI_G00203390 [Acnodon oligacanthus]